MIALTRPSLDFPIMDDPDSVMEDIRVDQLLTKRGTDAVRALIETLVPEGFFNQSLYDTPDRVVKGLKEMTKGYFADLEKILGKGFEETTDNYNQIILVKDVEFTSVCEHHLLPFIGVAHVAYIPQHKVVGISKLARVVDAFAQRFQIQERMTKQIVTALTTYIPTPDAACIVKAKHLCMGCRGVKKPDASTITSVLCGEFYKPEVRQELLTLIGSI